MTTRTPAIYLRKSKRLEESAAAQLASIQTAHPEAADAEVYSDVGVSGRRHQRAEDSAWGRLQADIGAGKISNVYISVLDRSGRSLIEFLLSSELFLAQSPTVGLIDQGGTDWMAAENRDRAIFEVRHAEREGEKAVERSARGHDTQAKRGDIFGRAPYGYMQSRDESGRVVHLLNPDEPLEPILQVVRETRGNILAATRLLNSRGVASRYSAWSPRALTYLVQREDKGLMRQIKARTGKAGLRAPSTLTNLVHCYCGGLMTPRPGKSGAPFTGSLYCYRGISNGGHGRYVARERHVIAVLEWLTADEREIKSVQEYSTEQAAERARRNALTDELRRAGIAYRAGAMTDEEFKEEASRLNAELTDLEDQIADTDESITIRVAMHGKLIDWEADQEVLGDQLRRVFRSVTLDREMLPERVEYR